MSDSKLLCYYEYNDAYHRSVNSYKIYLTEEGRLSIVYGDRRYDYDRVIKINVRTFGHVAEECLYWLDDELRCHYSSLLYDNLKMYTLSHHCITLDDYAILSDDTHCKYVDTVMPNMIRESNTPIKRVYKYCCIHLDGTINTDSFKRDTPSPSYRGVVACNRNDRYNSSLFTVIVADC